METPEESDQLPEEGPGAEDDTGSGSGNDGRHESPGVPGADEAQTGNPGAAGSEESSEDD